MISSLNDEEEVITSICGSYTPGIDLPKKVEYNGFTSILSAFNHGKKYLKSNFKTGKYCLEIVEEKLFRKQNIVSYSIINNGKFKILY